MAAPDYPHWLHLPAHTILARCNTVRPPTSPPFTTLSLQLYVTSNNLTHLLLFKPPKSNTWTVPSVLATNETRSFCDIALGALKNAIEERILPDLQFLGFASEKPVMEIGGPGRLVVKLFLSIATPRLEEKIVAHCDEVFEESRWVDIRGEQPKGKGKEKFFPPGQMEVVRQVLAGFEGNFQRLVSHHNEVCFLVANTIKTAVKLKQIDLGGEIITHALITRSAVALDVLYLMPTDEATFRMAQQQRLQEIQNPAAVVGGEFETRRYAIVGVAIGERVFLEAKFVSRTMVGEGWRVKVEWIQMTKRTKFVRVGQMVMPGQLVGLAGNDVAS